MEIIKLNGKEYISKEEYDKLNSKKEKEDFSIVEPCNVMAIVRVTEEGKNYKTSLKNLEFPKANKCKVFQDLNNKEQLELFVKNERFGKITTEFYEQAVEVTKLWNNLNKSEISVYAKEKDNVVLITDGSSLGFILAPRINED